MTGTATIVRYELMAHEVNGRFNPSDTDWVLGGPLPLAAGLACDELAAFDAIAHDAGPLVSRIWCSIRRDTEFR